MCDKGCWKLSGSSAQVILHKAFIASCRTYTPTPPFPYSSSLKFADRKSGGQFNRRAEAVVAPQQICLSEESIYSHILCLSFKLSFRTIPFPYPSKGGMGLCRTRMAEQKNLPALHAPPTASLPLGTCSPILSFHGGMGALPP